MLLLWRYCLLLLEPLPFRLLFDADRTKLMDSAAGAGSASQQQVLVGRYRYVKQLGKGGFGVVEQFKDLYTDSYVAIKTVPARFVAQETKRLAREIDIMVHLYNAHPHVMSIFEVFVTRCREHTMELDDEETPAATVDRAEEPLKSILADHPGVPTEQLLPTYVRCMRSFLQSFHSDDDFNLHIVMPLMKGDLFYFSKHIRSGQLAHHVSPGFLSQVCVVFAFQLCFGLDYLHKCNIVHRDLKPDNVLVWLDMENAYKSTAVIADFGLARDALATETFYICTRHYRPPEVITNTSRGETSIDVWSLGCIFYELVTSTTLFNLPTALNSKGQWEGVKASQQLEVILNTIGTPTPADIQTYMPTGNAQSYLLKSRARPSVLSDSIRTHWRLANTATEEQDKWIDLISSCLRFFPQQRPNIETLCCHTLFRDYNVMFGENVKQYPVHTYHPVSIPSHLQRSELKALVLRITQDALEVTSKTADAADVVASQAAGCLAEDHPSVAAAAPPRLTFPNIEHDALREKFAAIPVETDAQVDDALDTLLNEMELFTHDAAISRQLRTLLTYFAALKQLTAPSEAEDGAANGCVAQECNNDM